jgi:hypothetical protein
MQVLNLNVHIMPGSDNKKSEVPGKADNQNSKAFVEAASRGKSNLDGQKAGHQSVPESRQEDQSSNRNQSVKENRG